MENRSLSWLRRGLCLLALASLLLGCVLAASSSAAQDKKVEWKAKDDTTKRAAESKESLIIGLRAPLGQQKADIVESFGVVLKANGDSKDPEKARFGWKNLKFEKISKAAYEVMQKLVLEGPNLDLDDDDGRPRLRLREQVWEIDLRDEKANLQSIIIKSDKDGKPIEEEYELNKEKNGIKLRYDPKRGRYEIDISKLKIEPKAYILVKPKKGDPKGERLPERTWPQPDESYWLVKLEGWFGDEKEMFNAFGNSNILVGAVPSFADTRLSRIGVGAFAIPGQDPREGFSDRNHFRFAVPVQADKLKPEESPRAWMLFPLTKKEADDIAKNQLHDKGFVGLIEHIDKDTAHPQVLKDDKTAKLKADDKARWFELPLKVGQFVRDLEVEDIDKWWAKEKEPKAGSRSWRIVVWEVTLRGERQAVTFKVQGATKGATVKYIVQEVREWPAGLKRKAEKPEKPAKTTKPK